MKKSGKQPEKPKQLEKPVGYEQYLGEFKPCFFDPNNGECVAWGFEIVVRMGKEKFNELRSEVKDWVEYGGPNWFVIVKVLGRREAIEKYGAVTYEERGPRGGWRSATFGSKNFSCQYVSPEWQDRVDSINRRLA